MAAPNIVNVTSILGETTSGALSTTITTNLLTCASNKVVKVNTIIVSNDSDQNGGAASADATIFFFDASEGQRKALASNVTVPANSSLIVLSKDTTIYLEESDRIEGGASANNDLAYVISYEILDDA